MLTRVSKGALFSFGIAAIICFGVLLGQWTFRYTHKISVGEGQRIAMHYEVARAGMAVPVPLSLSGVRRQWSGLWLDTVYMFSAQEILPGQDGLTHRLLHVVVNAQTGVVERASGFSTHALAHR